MAARMAVFYNASQDSTVSERAYNALARVRGMHETSTNVMLRLTRKTTKGDLLEYLRSTGPNSQLANRIEKILKQRNMIRLRTSRANDVRKRQMTRDSKSIDRMRESSKLLAWSGAPRDQRVARSRSRSEGIRVEDNRYPEGADQNTGRADDEVRDTGGKRIQVVEATEGLMLRPILRMEDWVSADAGKCSYAEMVKELDNLRKKDGVET